MASLYKRGKRYWVGYTLNGERVERSLFTTNLRVARDKKRKIEYELAIGDLDQASKLPLFGDIYVSAFTTILFIEKTFGTHLRDYAVRISKERYALRQEILRSGFRTAGGLEPRRADMKAKDSRQPGKQEDMPANRE